MSRFGFAVLATLVVAQVNAGCETALVHARMLMQPATIPMEANSGLGRWREGLTQLEAVPPMRFDAHASCPSALATATATATAAPAERYVKQTEFDNTPYRFNMTQNGKRMSADDFDAWLEANGYSVGRRVELENDQD